MGFSMGFLVARITHDMALFVALKCEFHMNILTKCKLIVTKRTKIKDTVPLRGVNGVRVTL